MSPGVWHVRVGLDPDPRPTLFLDRDGVIVVDTRYLDDPDRVRLIPGAAVALARAAAAGWRLVCLTNQSGIGRGYYDEAAFARVQARIDGALAARGVILDAVFCCPHAPDAGCGCRKPAVGMVTAAAVVMAWSAGSWMIGDKAADVELGRAADLNPLLVLTGHGVEASAQVPAKVPRATDLAAAVDLILTADAS